MSPVELRASVSLASIFGLRLLGMFIILPVFAIYGERLPGGADLTLVGIAIGAYGLTQAVLQIPFGWWFDRYGRKRLIYIGLAIFTAGSFVAAAAPNIYVVILGRMLLEAMLPSLTSRLAPPDSKGVAIGLYSSVQFFGTFIGAAAGGYLSGRWGLQGVVIASALLLVMCSWRPPA